MVALSEDARLDRLERHVSSLWEQLHALSASMLQHAREGAKRDDKKKTHPDLVPFEQLSVTEQNYDRDVVESVLKAAIALGSTIQPPGFQKQ